METNNACEPKYPMPDIHFNGTDPVALTEGYINIHTLNWESQDSYTAFTAAKQERDKHLTNLSEFKKYIEEHIMHIRYLEV